MRASALIVHTVLQNLTEDLIGFMGESDLALLRTKSEIVRQVCELRYLLACIEGALSCCPTLT